MTFRVLGPLVLSDGEASVVLPPSKVIAMLAALLVRPNEVVSISELQSAIWGDDQPASAKAALQTCAMRLRQLFSRHHIAASGIETVPGGYRFAATGETLDLVRFRDLADQADQQTRPESRLVLLESALALWRGPTLANVPSEVLHRDTVPRLNEERLQVLEQVCDLKVRLGFAASALVQLWEATRSNPGNERLAELLIEALYRTGRQSDALAEYRRCKQHLAEELGVDPSPRLQQLELSILSGEERDRPQLAPAVVVAGLPEVVAPPGFVGHAQLLDELVARVTAGGGLTALTGMTGVGKTALARQLAGLAADRFDAGQLLIDMRDEHGEAKAGSRLAAELADWRRPDPARRRLLILDDVADVQQVQALASDWTSDDAVILTSQLGLTGVIARFGGRIARVAPLRPEESAELLASVLGEDLRFVDPVVISRLADLCGHLPLALRIAAARLLTRRTDPAESVNWLQRNLIDRLALPGDPDMTLLSRLQTALRRLPPDLVDTAAGLAATDQDIRPQDVADLLDLSAIQAEDALDQLVDANLLDELADRYRMPTLIGRYFRDTHHQLSHPARRPAVSVAGAVLTPLGTES